MTINLELGSPQATAALAHALAPQLRAGDLVALEGGLGAGKSFFARAVIGARLAALGRAETVPSPSYTLVQTYDLDDVELWHADLYRLGGPDEAAELGLEDAFEDAVCLVEWASRLGPLLPPRRLTVTLAFGANEDERVAMLDPLGPGWDPALAAALAQPAT